MSEQERLTFEEAYAQLEATVRQLEAGNLSLEKSLSLYERGMELAKLCAEQLDQAELRVRRLIPSPTGELTTEPFKEWQEP
ncbi:MAG: exodeoxyribonuclease VII small subunit [Anaerolineae bacterium]|nr:exodeoxyribonuclease VII small subunit [Anaerolineae bacterium]MDW8099324.1 exodeoxyribonuclease VII small subunit [Anaerolineae bacterium]